ncbi:UDP-4-amino-4,6-dideoxy-N-acetyl-beta-L-altrosamine N-acetyltransferase [Lacimicrobium alkaliphilum]|nr:UDP-4-amino-4,6-dideoxy-N-acetyl-beta-L-altrosamine N-acetyltransferase [Lacimicrobium alkaliphilum]
MSRTYPKSVFRVFDEHHLERVWKWRNQAHIRINMHNDKTIPWHEHLSWFESLKQDPTRQFFVFYQNDRPIGVLNFSGLGTEEPEWGCYLGEADIWPGSGLLLEVAALDYVADYTKAEALYAEVLSFNQAVIKLHRLFEYQSLESRDGGVREGKAFEVHRFRYPLTDWRQRRQSILKKLPAQIREASQLIDFEQELL